MTNNELTINALGMDVLKSALQKAFRRGDTELLIVCFNELWNDNPEWVILRSMVFATEDNWRSALNIGRAVTETRRFIRAKSPQEARGTLLAALVEESQCQKNQDANGLLCIVARYLELVGSNPTKAEKLRATLAARTDEHDMRSFDQAVDIQRKVTTRGITPKAVWNDIFAEVEQHCEVLDEEDSQDLRDAVNALFARDKRAADPTYHHLFLTSAILTLQRAQEGYSFDSVAATAGPLVTDTFGDEYRTPCPWYCMDMHTRVGKRALSYEAKVLRGKGFTKDFISDLWFAKETARVQEVDLDAIWWRLYVRMFVFDAGYNPDDADDLWQVVGSHIKKRVKVFSHD